MNNKITSLYKILKTKHGKPKDQWCLWCKRPKSEAEREEVIIGAILTQNTNWNNVNSAISNLKKARRSSIQDIYNLGGRGRAKLGALIRPSGFYKQKSDYLLCMADFIVNNYKNIQGLQKVPVDILRKEILKVKGVGPETADSILLYALDKPSFVIDEYTRRIVKENNIAKNLPYDFLKELFESNLKKNYKLYQDFHALIVIEGKKL